jgi:hypothetical protein
VSLSDLVSILTLSHGVAKARYQALNRMVGELGSLSSRIVKEKVVRESRGWMSSMEGFA